MPGTRAPAMLACVALAAAATGAAGCGAEGPTDQEAVRAKLLQLADATRAKRYETLCERVFDARLIAQVEAVGLPCEAAMERALGDVRDARLTIGRIRVDGRRASAEVRTSAAGEQPSRDIVQLVKGDAGWRVRSLAGASPPSPSAP